MLFGDYKLKNLELRNRIVMAPMTRCMSPDNIPGADVAEYYERRAKGEVGLIITEGIEVSHVASSSYPNVPRLDSKKSRDGWKLVVSKIKQAGGSVIAQLWHSGAMREAGMGPDPSIPAYTPSGLSSANNKNAHALTHSDIKKISDVFGQDAKWCEEIGFDGVEIHGAHGYLIDNFFWDTLNKREDQYGGSISKRSQFAKEITESIRAHVSNNFIVGMRFSQWKQQDFDHKMAKNELELGSFLNNLSNAGIDAFHCSQRRFWNNEFDDSNLNLAGWAKKLTNKPSITVGSIGLTEDFIETFQGKESKPTDISNLLERLYNDEYDFVAIGRALISNPDWPKLVKNEEFEKIKIFTPKDLEELV